MSTAFLTYYGQDPWSNIDKNQRTWYDPTLQMLYRRNTVYSNGLVPYVTQPLLPMNAQEMVFPMVFDFEPEIGEITEPRMTTVAPSGLDSKQVRVRSTRYAFATAYDKYDEYISFWRNATASGGDSRSAIKGLIQERVGRALQETLDLLIRNAFLSTPYISLPNDKTSASDLDPADKFSLNMVDDAILRAQSQYVWNNPSGGAQNLMCIGTPGQGYDIMTEAPSSSKWIELQKYTSQTPFNRYEIGSYHNSRHFNTTANVLWNCGPITQQKKIIAAANYRDGAPNPATDKVDGVYEVGQADSGVVRYIQLEAFAPGDFVVGENVTIHRRRNQAAQVTAQPQLRVLDAPCYDDADMVTRRIVSIDADNDRLVLDRPLMRPFNVEVATTGTGVATPASGCYGFVTRGLNLHANVMIAAPGGVVCGVFQPPRIYSPQPIDLYQSVWQVGYDMYLKFQVIKPEAFEVFITSGSARIATKKQI